MRPAPPGALYLSEAGGAASEPRLDPQIEKRLIEERLERGRRRREERELV
jgi:hypothetical protein